MIMEAILQSPKVQLQKNVCFSGSELQEMGVSPTNLQCFTYYHYVLYEKGNKRIILKPLPRNNFQVIRVYDFVEA